MKVSGVYKITCVINGKVYIGQSGDVERRFSEHRYRLDHGIHDNFRLQEEWGRYGEEGFRFLLIEKCADNADVRSEREIFWMEYYRANDEAYGYNIASGGNHGYSLYSLPYEQRMAVHRKIIKNREGKCVGRNHPNYGKPIPQEQREKISRALSGSKNPNYGKKQPEHSALMRGKGNPRARAVVCVNTGEVFQCAKEAGTKYGTTNSNILKCCRKRQKYAGVFNGDRLVWKYA